MRGILVQTETTGTTRAAEHGVFDRLPRKGQSFLFFTQPNDPTKDFRLIRTSPVAHAAEYVNVAGALSRWVIHTRNSVYVLSVLEDDDETPTR